MSLKKLKLLLVLLVIQSLVICPVYAEIIELKTGTVIKGTIIYRDHEKIEVSAPDGSVYCWLNEVKSIDFIPVNVEEPGAPDFKQPGTGESNFFSGAVPPVIEGFTDEEIEREYRAIDQEKVKKIDSFKRLQTLVNNIAAKDKHFTSPLYQEILSFYLLMTTLFLKSSVDRGPSLLSEKAIQDAVYFLESVEGLYERIAEINIKDMGKNSLFYMLEDGLTLKDTTATIGLYYALIAAYQGDIQKASQYAQKYIPLCEFNCDEVQNVFTKVIAGYKDIHADPDKLKILKAIEWLEVSLYRTPDFVTELKILYDKVEFHAISDKKQLLRDLKKSLKTIHSHLATADNIELHFLDDPALDLVDTIKDDAKMNGDTKKVVMLYACTLQSLIASLIFNAKGLYTKGIVTWDFNALRLRWPGKGASFKEIVNYYWQGKRFDFSNDYFGHALNLIQVDENEYVFVDVTNNWISDLFNKDQRYGENTFLYHEQSVSPKKLDLLKDFVEEKSPGRGLLSSIYANLASVANDKSDISTADYFLRRAEYFWPENPARYGIEGDILFNSGRYPESIELLKKGLSIYPGDFSTQYSLARAFFENKNYEDALRIAQEGYRDSGEKFVNFAAVIVNVYLAANNHEQALLFAKEQLKKHNESPVLNQCLGYIYLETNKPEQGKKYLQKAVELYERNLEYSISLEIEELLKTL
ncbi:MAG TPA: hypothetical protein VLJ10_01225 [Candidatus Bathyarchaeia archaeon]|nr:hypothetical protein [Candidatus Bathyarchaeia archaeon]